MGSLATRSSTASSNVTKEVSSDLYGGGSLNLTSDVVTKLGVGISTGSSTDTSSDRRGHVSVFKLNLSFSTIVPEWKAQGTQGIFRALLSWMLSSRGAKDTSSRKNLTRWQSSSRISEAFEKDELSRKLKTTSPTEEVVGQPKPTLCVERVVGSRWTRSLISWEVISLSVWFSSNVVSNFEHFSKFCSNDVLGGEDGGDLFETKRFDPPKCFFGFLLFFFFLFWTLGSGVYVFRHTGTRNYHWQWNILYGQVDYDWRGHAELTARRSTAID